VTAPDQRELVEQKLAQLLAYAVFVSVLLECFSANVLDLGQCLTGCTIGLVGYWAGAAMILLRRRRQPSRGDLGYMRIAPPVLAIGAIELYSRFGGWAFRLGSMFGPS
jgi:hypothetical protein